jgi:hypothetical protein
VSKQRRKLLLRRHHPSPAVAPKSFYEPHNFIRGHSSCGTKKGRLRTGSPEGHERIFIDLGGSQDPATSDPGASEKQRQPKGCQF